MNQTKKKIIRPTALAFLLALGLSAAMPAGAGTAYAQPVQESQPAGEASGETAQGGYWMNLEEGPGVANRLPKPGNRPVKKPRKAGKRPAKPGKPPAKKPPAGSSTLPAPWWP